MSRRSTAVIAVLLVALSGGATGAVGATGASDRATAPTTAATDLAATQQAAAVTLDDQTTGGYTVTVDRVTLPEGGFVALHDATLADGDALGSVVGASAYLAAGTHENVTVRLSQPLNETGSLIAMPHADDGDRVYEFVSTGGTADGPYTADGGAVTDAANVTVSATVAASDQPTDGASVVVDRVELSAPGFVVVHNESLLSEGDAVGSVVGHSALLSPGVHEDVRIELDAPVGNETMVPMAHRDTDGDGAYAFPDADGPFATAAGDAVVDTADLATPAQAGVTLANQSSGGTGVVVDSAFLPDGGYVVVHDESGAVVGNSAYLSAGLHRSVTVDLDAPLNQTDSLTAMAHLDTNGDEVYEFPDADDPYTADGGAVVDAATVTVSASLAYDVGESDGNAVVIDSVDLSEGGFVVVHDPSLFAGDVTGSVLGASEYLEPGVHENVTVELSTPANESQVLVPMAHRDTDGDEAYGFPDADGPYTADGGAVVSPAKTVVRSQVTFGPQETGGETVTVDSVTLADGGFVTVHDATLLDGEALGSVRGTSAYLGPGTHTDVEVALDEPLTGNATLLAMPHYDTNGNEAYDFVTSEGARDGPYTAAGSAVVASAAVTAMDANAMATTTSTEATDTEASMNTETPTASDTPPSDGADDEGTPTTGTDAPGFGVAVALAGLLAAALLVRRR